MEDCDKFDPPQKVSYLQARDPSILSWNRHGIEKVRHNLVSDFESESTITSIPSEKEDNHIKVYLRIKAGEDYDNLYIVEDETLICKVPEGSYSARHNRDNRGVIKKYQFTHIFEPNTGQHELFNQIVKPKMLNFINGRNSTLLAYGASGAGKTFTMVGTAEQPGIIPRALEYLFRTIPVMNNKPGVKPLPNGDVVILNDTEKVQEQQKLQSILPYPFGERSVHIKTYKAMQQRLSNDPVAMVEHSPPILSVYVSFAEIYNEFVYDLLQPTPVRGSQRPSLKIGGLQDQIYVKGLKYIYVRSGLEAYQVLQYGINNLKYADTAVNMHSSRSHCIFTIRLVQGWDVKNSNVSTFNFCDLAGSERLKKTMNVGDRLKESNNINSSLLVLGRCISNIRDGQYNKENKLPPFRESKLTQIFQRALMGKEDIFMIVNINPSRDMFDESQHTLNFAGIAKEINIEVQPPKILKPNRFSSSFPQTELLPYIKEDEREEELRELRDERANLVLELSQLRQDQEEALEAERRYLRGLFDEMVALKDSEIRRLEEENKKLLEKTRDSDVIILSDDDDSDEECEETMNLIRENHNFKTEIYNLKEKHRMEIKQKDINIANLEKDLEVARQTIEEAKSDFKQILEDNTKLRREVCDLNVELCTLRDDFDMQQMELDELRHFKLIDRENIEMLTDENTALQESMCSAMSPKTLFKGLLSTGHTKSASIGDSDEITIKEPIDSPVVSAVSSPSLPSKRQRDVAPKKNMQDPKFLKPFKYGWKRELVWRSTSTASKPVGDIYYHTPSGKKVRSFREVSDHLTDKNLLIDNFSFTQEPLGIDDPEKEIIRHAKIKSSHCLSESPAPKKVVEIKKPKMILSLKGGGAESPKR